MTACVNENDAIVTADEELASEQLITNLLFEDLGISISPKLLRRFLRQRWGRIHAAAHRIHEGKR